jgi:putative chitinase
MSTTKGETMSNNAPRTPLTILQQKIGVRPDGVWGPMTYRAARSYFKLTHNRAAHFFAQCAHETGNFRHFSENLNYSADGLRTKFRRYFTTIAIAQQYARKPQAIANRAYGNRMGNGDEASGDGWRFRGRGALQLTGRNNYTAFATWAKRPDVLTAPDIVATDLAFESAMWFFDTNKLWTLCDAGITDDAITKLTKRINGGTNGLADRLAKTKQYATWI